MKILNWEAIMWDCLEEMKKIPDWSIDLIITSPPYNKWYWSRNRNINNWFKTKVRKITYWDFDDNLNPKEYEAQQTELLSECIRVIKPTGSIFYNHIDILYKHQTIHPKYVYDFPLKQIIIWNRKNTPKLDKSYFFPINEYIFWIKKTSQDIPKFNRKNAIFQKNIWDISPETNNDFPAPFPISIAENIILSCSNEWDIILDPFAWSFTTAVACENANRKWICIEKEKECFDIGVNRLLSTNTNK